ncbi:MAG: DUF1800 domain-containing protein [Verrucomicrobiota bacterium]
MLKPLSKSKWNYTTAAHLLNRAGFGGPPAEIDRLVKMGPEKAVDHFVDYEKIPDATANPAWAKPDPGRMDKFAAYRKLNQRTGNMSQEERRSAEEKRRVMQREEQRTQIMQILELRGWWIERMAKGSRPLQEKLTLFWHGHFATSAQKVRDSYFMWLQNETFRTMGSGNWLEMLYGVAKDPAMLLWLDQAQSRKQHPNENFAREVMELFALGEGNYTEQDVTEAARAMTGWTLNRIQQKYEYRENMHDDAEKTFLGKTGNLNGLDVLKVIVDQPQAARFITAKIWKFFGSDNPSDELIEALASNFRGNGNFFKPFLRTLFRSEEFYDAAVIRAQVKSPVQWLVGSIRMLERDLPAPVVSSQLLRNLGQELLMPPNVKGWDGGLSWITTNNLLNRYNESAMLVLSEGNIADDSAKKGMRRVEEYANKLAKKMPVVDVSKIVSPEEKRSKQALVAALEKRFLQTKLKDKQAQTLRDFLDGRGDLDDQDIRHTIRLIMSTPEYQLT